VLLTRSRLAAEHLVILLQSVTNLKRKIDWMSGRRSLDAINRPVWADSVRQFLWDGWADAGERVATERVKTIARDKPILDLGVGCGRTLPLLRALSSDYVAIDYTPEMVDVCQRRFPGATILEADARDLSRFEDGSFALVSFSLNGIDAVDHEDRVKIVAEVFRVLKPGGAFQYSTHNKLGPGPKQRPWSLQSIDLRSPRDTARRVKERCLGLRSGLRNYRRYKAITADGDDWCIRVGEAHNFGIVIHFITPLGIMRELSAAGFSTDVEIYDDVRGLRVQPAADTSHIWYFNVVAFKPS
jgi:SAM-dependent methyltransferase